MQRTRGFQNGDTVTMAGCRDSDDVEDQGLAEHLRISKQFSQRIACKLASVFVDAALISLGILLAELLEGVSRLGALLGRGALNSVPSSGALLRLVITSANLLRLLDLVGHRVARLINRRAGGPSRHAHNPSPAAHTLGPQARARARGADAELRQRRYDEARAHGEHGGCHCVQAEIDWRALKWIQACDADGGGEYCEGELVGG